jgi:sulfate adenylyltransferase (ADP) / ATP adenylyltransferase
MWPASWPAPGNDEQPRKEADEMGQYRPGTLWDRVVETSRRALRQEAMRPIPTSFEYLEDGGVRFLVRVVQHLAEKPRSDSEAAAGVTRPNPFLPYEPALFVAEAGTRHVCLLNKFNVVDHHLLIVTRDFVHQDCPLEPDDFDAWWRCLNEYDSLGFYNGGTLAGASQPHRHLQLIPLPLADFGPRIPTESLLMANGPAAGLSPASNQATFTHAFVCLEHSISGATCRMGAELHRLYLNLLDRTAVSASIQPDGRLSKAYNLLLTRQWMLLVPRRCERVAGISLNAMAFAGAFLTSDQQQLEQLRGWGPMAALAFAAG